MSSKIPFLIGILFFGQTVLGQQNNELTIEYLAHASFKITYGKTTILLDPYADKIWLGYNFPEDISADVILSTHPHYDHDGGQFLGKTPYWQDKIPFYQNPGTYTIGDFKITGIKGKHCDPYGKEFGQKNTIWKIEVKGYTLVHLGDNGPLTQENYEAIGTVDILFVPIDAQFHILKEEELEVVLETIQPNMIIPMHYRIPELEVDPNKPEDLGDIDPYLIGRKNVKRLQGNIDVFNSHSFERPQQIVVFKHSPKITR